MANEIIALHRGNGKQEFVFLYAIPPAKRIEIGGSGTTGKHPVPTPAPTDADDPLYIVLTADERTALDAGEALTLRKSWVIPDGQSDADLLAQAQAFYTSEAPDILDWYETKYKYIGRRFDAS